MSRLLLPVEKHEHSRRCQPCEGTGVTGERYEMPAGENVLVLEVICGVCGGCGNGDPDHAGCKPDWHAYPYADGSEPLEDDEEGAPCFSCGSGRGWYPVEGFRGEGDDMEMVITRVPCGCSESRLLEAEDG